MSTLSHPSDSVTRGDTDLSEALYAQSKPGSPADTPKPGDDLEQQALTIISSSGYTALMDTIKGFYPHVTDPSQVHSALRFFEAGNAATRIINESATESGADPASVMNAMNKRELAVAGLNYQLDKDHTRLILAKYHATISRAGITHLTEPRTEEEVAQRAGCLREQATNDYIQARLKLQSELKEETEQNPDHYANIEVKIVERTVPGRNVYTVTSHRVLSDEEAKNWHPVRRCSSFGDGCTFNELYCFNKAELLEMGKAAVDVSEQQDIEAASASIVPKDQDSSGGKSPDSDSGHPGTESRLKATDLT